MTIRNRKTLLSTLATASIITLAANSAIAGDCNWMKGKNTSDNSRTSDYHHAVFYSAADSRHSGGFIKAAHHEAKTSVDIVDTAVAAGNFNTLVTAIKAAGLVDILKGEGPFTVFAPTDEAFAKIPKDDLSALLKDKDTLTKILTYHVVPGKVMAADVTKLSSADTLEGQPISIDSKSGVKVNNANVIKADIATSNGVIHVIDTVLMPPS